MRRIPREGLTLIEVLVTIGVIGVLAGLLLPAVQAARESARRAQCTSNMRQLGLAAHAYEGTWQRLPAAPMSYAAPDPVEGPFDAAFSAHCALLSMVEQAALYDSINLSGPCWDYLDVILPHMNMTSASSAVGVYLCPSDGKSRDWPWAPTNYRANLGVCLYCADGVEDGAFRRGGTRIAEIRDGLSNTLLFSEKLLGTAGPGDYHPARDWISGFPRGLPADSVAMLATSAQQWRDFCARRSYRGDRPHMRFDAGGSWLYGRTRYTGFLTSATPNSPIPDCGLQAIGGIGIFAARSAHPGGVVAVMADGSARFVRDGIAQATWKGLGTRAAGDANLEVP